MSKHHLCDSDRTPPSNIISNANLQLPFDPLLLGGQKDLDLLDVILEQWFEIAPIAKPQQGPELLLELVLTIAYLPIDPLFAIFVDGKHVVEQEDGKLVRPFDLYLIRAEEFDKWGEIVRFIALLGRRLQVVSRIKGIAFEGFQIIALVFD